VSDNRKEQLMYSTTCPRCLRATPLAAIVAVFVLAVSGATPALAADTWEPYDWSSSNTSVKAIATPSAKDPCRTSMSKLAFAVGTDESPLVAEWYEDPSTSTWGTFTPIGAKVNTISATILCGVPEVFAIGKDNALWTNATYNRPFGHQGFTWDGYRQLSSEPITAVAAVASAANRIDVFVIQNNRLKVKRRINGIWQPYIALASSAFVKGIATTSPYPGRIDLFAIGQDDAVWTMHSINDAWTNFVQLEPNAVNSITASSPYPNRVDLFVMGRDNALWTKHGTNDVWTTYRQLATNQIRAIAAAAPKSPGDLDVFVVGTDYHFWEKQGHASTP
jgi:hypothetical protein